MDERDDFQDLRWAIVGAGRVGKTLGLLAKRLRIPVAATWNRSEAAARQTAALLGPQEALCGPIAEVAGALVRGADVVWVTVVDTSIAAVARSLAPFSRPAQIVLHTAGSLSSEVLSEAGIRSKVGSLHPLQAITDPTRALDTLSDVAWTFDGQAQSISYARWLMGKINVDPVVVDSSKKALYHASAVTSANLLVALMDAAFTMAQAAGMSREQAREMMLPLARSSVENLERQDTREALSGPAARGDQATIDRHIEALKILGDQDLAHIYEVLIERAKKIAGK